MSAQPAPPEDDDTPPSLHLLPGDFAFDVDTIMAMFTAVTGRVPTAADVAEVRAYLDQHKH